MPRRGSADGVATGGIALVGEARGGSGRGEEGEGGVRRGFVGVSAGEGPYSIASLAGVRSSDILTSLFEVST